MAPRNPVSIAIALAALGRSLRTGLDLFASLDEQARAESVIPGSDAYDEAADENCTGDTSSYDDSWLDAVTESPCPDPLPAQSGCLSIAGREFHLPDGRADLRTVSFGRRIELEYTGGGESPAIRVTASYPGELTESVDCELDGASITVAIAERELTSAPFGVPRPCTMNVPDPAVEVGGLASGSIETLVGEEGENGELALEFTWADTLVE